MDIAGNLVQSVAQGLAGLIAGALRAASLAVHGVFHALQVALPGAWLPIAAAGIVGLFMWWRARG